MKQSKTILLVDDDVDIINVVKTILEHEGYSIITASGKNEALQLLKTQKPDLAILDVMMSSRYEGFELAEAIVNSSEITRLPILMQTSIEVFESSDPDVLGLAKQYRSNVESKDLEVILVQDRDSGKAGIDYRDESGKLHWIPVNGFISKPVNSKVLLPEINNVLNN